MNKNLLIDHNLKINDYKLDIEKIFNSNSFTQGKINQQFKNKLKKNIKLKIAFFCHQPQLLCQFV